METNATVNEIVDESTQINRLTKELNDLKKKQSEGTLSSAERQQVESEKMALHSQIESLQQEKVSHYHCYYSCCWLTKLILLDVRRE